MRSAALRPWRAAGLAIALGLVGLAAAGDEVPIYRWVDEAGVPHFTDRAEEVPPGFRDQLGLPADPEETEAPASGRAFGPAPGASGGATAALGEVGAWQDMDAGAAWKMLARLAPGVLLGSVLIGLALLGLVAAFGAFVLRVACRLVGQERPGFGKAMAIVAVQIVAGLFVWPGVVLVLGPAQSVGGLLGLQATNMAATLAVHAAVLRAMLCETFGRAVAIALMVVVVSFAIGLALALGFVSCGVGGALLRGG